MEKKPLRPKLIWLMLLTLIIAAALNAITILESRKVYQTEELDVFVKVSNYTGFNVDTDAIYFGTLPNSGKSTRIVQIANSDRESKVMLDATGMASEWIIITNKTFIMRPGETANIPISIIIPSDAPEGSFDGRLRIRFIKP